jgi:hypothetical protein
MMLIKGIKITLASLLFAVLLPAYSPANAPLIPPASQTLTICTSLKSGSQYISSTGRCNERIYEKSVWFQEGNSPVGTPGSKQLSLVICTSKGDGISKTLRKKCNPTTQVTSKWQRPLGPPEAPIIISVTADKLGTAVILMKAPVNNGGARITSYSIIEVSASTGRAITANKTLASSAASFPTKPQQSTTLTGLTPGMTYRFAATATNAAGTSAISESSAPFFAPTVPDAPTITSVIANGSNSAVITYTAPVFDGGSPITSYTATAFPGGIKATAYRSTAGTIKVSGLVSSTSYTFSIVANNFAGSSLPSTISAEITTFAPPPPPEPVAPPPPPAPALAAPAFTLSSSSETGIVNTAATGFTINSTGGAIASFEISATPAGMSFNATTGALTGTPTTVAGATAYTITATNATGSTTQTFTLTINPGAATKAMMTTQPAGAVNGVAFTTQPVVRVTDSGGNTVTTSTVVVTVSKASGSGTLSGTTTATAVAGVATFTNLVITGTGDHVLTFTPETLTAVNSETLTVSLSAQATLSITSLTTNTKAHDYLQALSITTSGGSGTGATTFAIASGGTASGCTLSNSSATATITATTVGTCLIQATKAADATYASTTSATATFTFTKATQTITFTDPADIAFGASPASLSATSTSTLSVAFTTATSGVCTVSGTTVTIVSVGTCTINANQAGNADYEAASQVSQSFTIAKATPSLSSFANISKTVGNPAFNLSAPTVANSLPGSFTYTSATTATATISGATVTLGSAGTTVITATFTPTDTTNYNNATIAMTLTVTAAVYSVGDRGPGGGIVFYVASSTFTQFGATGAMCTTTCKYLEVAPAGWDNGGVDADDPGKAWSSNQVTPTDQDKTNDSTEGVAANSASEKLNWKIGQGFYNTSVMAVADATSDAQAAVLAYTGGGFTGQWFIPSMNELNELCKYARGQTTGNPNVACSSTGTLKTRFRQSYWSSSEAAAKVAWNLSFSSGVVGGGNKNTGTIWVRPIRAFGAPIVDNP